MGRQLTIRMSEEMAAKLEETARLLRRRRSQVVRLALERFFQDVLESTPEGPFRPIERVRDLLDRWRAGCPISANDIGST